MAKAIGSNPLAGFPSQNPASPVGAGGLGAWPSKPEELGLINGLMNGTTVELKLQRPFGSDFDDF